MQLQRVVSHSKGVRAKQQLLLLVLHPFSGLFPRITLVRQCQKSKASLDLNEARDDGVLGWQWHQLDHMQSICTSLQTDNHTNTSSLHFYRPDALPDAKPTASKHWRHFILLNKLSSDVWPEVDSCSSVLQSCSSICWANFYLVTPDIVLWVFQVCCVTA